MYRSFAIVLFFCASFWSSISAQKSFFTHLCSLTPEKITLTTNWDSLIAFKDDSSIDGVLNIITAAGDEEWKVELTLRGRFRRATCKFPPLEINLKKGALRERGLLEFDKLKLVTDCKAENADPADLSEELLLYQLYGILTPYSYKAIPLQLDYLYPNGKSFQKNANALLLEPTRELAYRLNEAELEMYGASEDSLDASSYTRNALFQFMIANFDWDLIMQRNVKMIGKPGHYHVVPYDFDFSAIVMPVYARLPGDLNLKDFRDRIYLGNMFESQLPVTIQEFKDRKEEFIAHVTNYDRLTKLRRKEIVSFLEQFYNYVENPSTQLTYRAVLRYDAN